MSTTARIQELLDQLNEGGDQARDALLEHSLERLRLLARRMLRRQNDLRALEETDDILSKAIIRLHRALTEVRPADVRAFIGLAARNVRWVLCDLAREKAARSKVSYAAAPPEPSAPDGEPADLLEWADFHAAIEALPDAERELFDALFYQGLEQAEAAEVLGVPLRTLKRRWQHARLRLVEKMQGRMPGEALS
jgi:RNA polymerase sigma factor (sigma-70 family)